MPTDIFGNDANFNLTTTFSIKVPVDTDFLNAASVTSAITAPETGFYPPADAGEYLRKTALGVLSLKSVCADGTGGAASTATAGQVKASAQVIGGTGVTATTGNVTATAGNLVATAGNVVAGSGFVSATKLVATTARSSATPGTGQSMAAGEVWKDSSVFAFCRLRQTGANAVSVVRSLNLGSAPTEAVSGKYVFTLQTAAPNGLVISVLVCHAGAAYMWSVPPSTITTSAFEVWVFLQDGSTLTELSVNDELHVTVTGY